MGFVASTKYKRGNAQLFSDLMRFGSVTIASTFSPEFLDALTLHRSPSLLAGLRENELRRWLRQDVVAKYLLGRRRCCWGSANRVQKHWSAFLVLRPSWCWGINILEARRDLNRKTIDMSFPVHVSEPLHHENTDSRMQEKQNDYHISDIFDLVFPNMSLLEPGHHCDGAGASICHSLLQDLLLVNFGLLLGVAGCSRTTVGRGSGVVI